MSKYKFYVIKLKTSTIFPVRTRCKFCLSGPEYYFRFAKPLIRKTPAKFFPLRCGDVFNYELSFRKIEYREFSLEEHSYKLNFNKHNMKANRERHLIRKHNFDELLYCHCSETCWYFNLEPKNGRKEIIMRQSPILFDKEFMF